MIYPVHRRRKLFEYSRVGEGGKVQSICGFAGGGGGGQAGCKLIGVPAPKQFQIITFLTLKTYNIAKLRIELKSILEIPSNKIKGRYLSWYIFYLVFTVSHRH